VLRRGDDAGDEVVLVAFGPGDSEDRAQLDGFVPEQEVFDLERRHVLAPDPEPVAQSVHEVEQPVIAEHRGVARVEPGVAQRSGGGVGLSEVAREQQAWQPGAPSAEACW
jgi:hypothetical protein